MHFCNIVRMQLRNRPSYCLETRPQFVQRGDNFIQRINRFPADGGNVLKPIHFIRWIATCPLDKVIRSLNNWGQSLKVFRTHMVTHGPLIIVCGQSCSLQNRRYFFAFFTRRGRESRATGGAPLPSRVTRTPRSPRACLRSPEK